MPHDVSLLRLATPVLGQARCLKLQLSATSARKPKFPQFDSFGKAGRIVGRRLWPDAGVAIDMNERPKLRSRKPPANDRLWVRTAYSIVRREMPPIPITPSSMRRFEKKQLGTGFGKADPVGGRQHDPCGRLPITRSISGTPTPSRRPFPIGSVCREVALASQMRGEPGQGGGGRRLPQFHGGDGIVACVLSPIRNRRVSE